ncbi:MAG: MFS transporter, partial [Actinomycetia bacterium]|nr:MFS transporter [Actinomycetes bacterium]
MPVASGYLDPDAVVTRARGGGTATGRSARGANQVLLTLAAGQFLMTLDSSVMNVSIATVAEDLGTTVTGIQSAITLYGLVMAALMITGGKISTIVGRRRAFTAGCVVYGAGSFVTSVAPNLAVLLFGFFVPIIFGRSIAATGSPNAALWSFVALYAVGLLLNY